MSAALDLPLPLITETRLAMLNDALKRKALQARHEKLPQAVIDMIDDVTGPRLAARTERVQP
jgi:hypothetical protein